MKGTERKRVSPITHMLCSGIPLNHRGGGVSEHRNISVVEIAQHSSLGTQKKVLTVHRSRSWVNEIKKKKKK